MSAKSKGFIMIIFLDLDGVIINWSKGVCSWFNIPYEPEKITYYNAMYELTGIDYGEFWNRIRTPLFWENLDFYPGAESFIEELKKYGTVILLTSPAISCAGYRQNWIQKNLPEFFNGGRYIITSAKWACANKGTVLIDDSDKNCNDFARYSGRSIIYPQPWNLLRGINEDKKNNLVIKELLEIL